MKVLVIDAADTLEVAHPPLGEQFQIVDQPRHRRVVAVGRLGLQRQAFGQVAGADSGRVERLDQGQCLFGLGLRCARIASDVGKRRRQVAGLVELLDDDLRQPCNCPRRAEQLRHQMFAQRRFAGLQPVEIEAFAIARRDGHVGEAVRFQRRLFEVVIERPIVFGGPRFVRRRLAFA